jgi:hypothetical protein
MTIDKGKKRKWKIGENAGRKRNARRKKDRKKEGALQELKIVLQGSFCFVFVCLFVCVWIHFLLRVQFFHSKLC